MAFTVYLTDDAVRDLDELHEYIRNHDTPEKADWVLGQIEQAFSGLLEFPERGVYPQELSSFGIREYREVFFRPYRIIYRVLGLQVFVLLIADGRRDMRTLLERRLLEA